MTSTDYINRVKKGIELNNAMAALKDGETLSIQYKANIYMITAYEYKRSTGEIRRSYTITDDELFGRSMNIADTSDGTTKSYLLCYTYDLFKTQTTKKLYFDEITIVN